MIKETAHKIREIFTELEKDDPDISTEQLLSRVADTVNQRGLVFRCDIVDVTEALYITKDSAQ